MALIFMIGEAILIVLDLYSPTHSPYIGILIYIVGPTILVAGLVLVPLGIAYEARFRKTRGRQSSLVIDLTHPRHRRHAAIFVLVTIPFLGLSTVGTYQAYHITESVEFCGKLCHAVMEPEFVAYQNSSHARLQCTACHIGPGAGWYVKSKLSGAYQVYSVLSSSYTLPIETPLHDLRPARDTCEQCHWPEKFSNNIERVRTHYADDDENTPYRVVLSLKVGGGHPERGAVGGMHWHVSSLHKVEYIATDVKRLTIPYVRVTHEDGKTEEFLGEGVDELGEIATNDPRLREMDCIDCHNRPSHAFLSPAYSVDRAIDSGQIDPRLPNIKGLAVGLLSEEYATQEEASTAIADGLRETLASEVETDETLKAALDQAIGRVQRIYSTNQFPEAGVSWKHYPDHSGHFRFPGCYRCHDDEHQTAEGRIISNDCNLCHTINGQAEGWDEVKEMEVKRQAFVHPRDMEGVEEGTNCSECHGV